MFSSVESFKRVVVEGRWDGSVIPGKIEEVAREVFVRPGAHVVGGVFGDRVEIEGGCRIEKSVYGSRELRFVVPDDVTCESSVGCKQNILCDNTSGVLRIYGDVIAKDVTLRRAAILGGVHGRNIRLSECVVLGPVLAENRAILSHCCVMTANANELQLGPGNSVIMPFMMAGDSISMSDPVQNVLVGGESGQMYEDDIVEHEAGKTLSLGRRVTDLGKIEKGVDEALAHIQYRVLNPGRGGSGGPVDGRPVLPEMFVDLLDGDRKARPEA